MLAYPPSWAARWAPAHDVYQSQTSVPGFASRIFCSTSFACSWSRQGTKSLFFPRRPFVTAGVPASVMTMTSSPMVCGSRTRAILEQGLRIKSQMPGISAFHHASLPPGGESDVPRRSHRGHWQSPSTDSLRGSVRLLFCSLPEGPSFLSLLSRSALIGSILRLCLSTFWSPTPLPRFALPHRTAGGASRYAPRHPPADPRPLKKGFEGGAVEPSGRQAHTSIPAPVPGVTHSMLDAAARRTGRLPLLSSSTHTPATRSTSDPRGV